jgi:hypothetical protein
MTANTTHLKVKKCKKNVLLFIVPIKVYQNYLENLTI